jgi:hypothetical protein
MTNFADLATQVAKQFRRDEARKQRILARSPQLGYALDAAEFARMSSKELAERELKELGISAGDSDPEAILDAHHAGRKWARDYQIPGNRLTGGNTIQGNNGIELKGGSASDAHEGGSFIDRYIVGDGK